MKPRPNFLPSRPARPARFLALGFLWMLGGIGLHADQPVVTPEPGIDPRLGPPFTARPRPTLGQDNAPIVVLEVSSFACGHCRLFHENVFGTLRARYVDTNKVQWFMLNASFDYADASDLAFVLGRCADRHGKFWEIAGDLFQNGTKPAGRLMQLLGTHPALDRNTLSGCLQDRSLVQLVLQDFAEVQGLKLKVTPTFFVRRIHPDGRRTETIIEGYQSSDYFQQVFDRLLAMP